MWIHSKINFSSGRQATAQSHNCSTLQGTSGGSKRSFSAAGRMRGAVWILTPSKPFNLCTVQRQIPGRLHNCTAYTLVWKSGFCSVLFEKLLLWTFNFNDLTWNLLTLTELPMRLRVSHLTKMMGLQMEDRWIIHMCTWHQSRAARH